MATDGQAGRRDKISKNICVMCGRNVKSVPLLEVSLLGIGPVLRLETDVWSTVK